MRARVPVQPWPGEPGQDEVVVEEPLELRVEGQPVAITLRTPGQDLDLAAGFLWTEGVIDGADDLRALATVADNVVDVRLAEGVPPARARSADRAFFATSSCGICGTASMDRIRRKAPVLEPWRPEPELLRLLPARLEALQENFGATGGLHAAAIFDRKGELLFLREDVGRHNAMDKVLGAALRAERDVYGLGMVVTSRLGFELVQKCWMGGLSALVAFGAPTSLAVQTAHEGGLCLVGWLRPGRMVYF